MRLACTESGKNWTQVNTAEQQGNGGGGGGRVANTDDITNIEYMTSAVFGHMSLRAAVEIFLLQNKQT